VSWQSTPGAVYEVMTNAMLSAPQGWHSTGEPITATDTSTRYILPGLASSTQMLFVLIREDFAP